MAGPCDPEKRVLKDSAASSRLHRRASPVVSHWTVTRFQATGANGRPDHRRFLDEKSNRAVSRPNGRRCKENHHPCDCHCSFFSCNSSVVFWALPSRPTSQGNPDTPPDRPKAIWRRISPHALTSARGRPGRARAAPQCHRASPDSRSPSRSPDRTRNNSFA